jgi:hypothetical protein
VLRQMPHHKARSHPTNAVLVHTHPLVKEGFGDDVYSDLRSALGVSDQKLADSLSIPMRTPQPKECLGRSRKCSRRRTLNSVGTRVVYCASTLALAVLEVRVQIPLANFPPPARYVGLEILIDSAVSRLT